MTAEVPTAATAPSASTWQRWRRPVIGVALGAAAWTGVVGVWLPDWARPRAEAEVSKALGTPVRIQAIEVHPWTLTVALQGLSVGPQDAPIAQLRQALVQLSLESVWRLAPVLSRVTLDEADIYIERQAAERFNFSPILAHLQAQPASQPSAEPARFAVFNIALNGGRVRYVDQVLGQTHVIDQIQLGVPFVSSLASFQNVDVQPLLAARIDGAPLRIEGRTLPFTAGLRSEVKLQWRGVNVPQWVAAAKPFMPPQLQVQADSGQLDTDLTVQFEERKPPQVPRLAITGGLSLSKLALQSPNLPGVGAVQAGWADLKVQGLDLLPMEHQAKVQLIDLSGLTVHTQPAGKAAAVTAARAGVPAAAPATPAKSSEALPAPWAWHVQTLKLSAPELALQTLPQAAWPALRDVAVSVQGLDGGAKAAPAAWTLSLHDAHGAEVQASGHAQLSQQVHDATVSLKGLALKPWLDTAKAIAPMPVVVQQGDLGLQLNVQAHLLPQGDQPASVAITQSQVTLSKVAATTAQAGDKLAWADLGLTGIDAQLALGDQPGLRKLTLGDITLDGLNAVLTRNAQGQWLGMAAHASPASSASSANKTAKGKATSPSPLPDVLVQQLSCKACQIKVTDQTVQPAAQFVLAQTQLSVTGASSQLDKTLHVKLNTLAQGQGRVQFDGDVRPQPLLVKSTVNVVGLDLRAIQPYIDDKVNVQLAGAKAHVGGQLQVQDVAKQGLQVRYKGRVALSDLRVLDRVNEADFLSWRQLALDGMDVSWSEQALDADLGRISLQDFYGRVIINPNGKINLAGIVRHEADAPVRSLTTPEAAPASTGAKPVTTTVASSMPAASAASAPAAEAPAKPMQLRWQGIALRQGRIDFTDNFIKPNYSARLTQIDGAVSAVSSTQAEPAQVAISGAVDDAAPLKVTGTLHPLGPKLFTDIEGSAKGIELTRLTPYASRYAGYTIDKGTLSVTVHYKVDSGKLQATNQIFLDQLTFGDKTDSPEATSLPVRFAVSLLKNSQGEIDVNLPISGSLDDPQFSVGGIIWRVLANLITKAVTAPFALLSGGGSDELGFVPFDAGVAELNDAARQRLDTLAKKLTDRPALKLEATGHADAADVLGLRQAHVMGLMRAAKSRATGQPLDDVRVEAAERSTWLLAAYKAADIKKPRNLVGLAKTLPDAEMEALLQAAAPADAEALRALANRRGDLVKAYLSTRLPPERVLLTASKLPTDSAAAPASSEDKAPVGPRVQFAVR